MRRLFLLPLALSLVAGCGPVDTDEDLLTDEFEALIGTDPELADTDGDGFSDAYEHFLYFSPRSETDTPYEYEDGDEDDWEWDAGTADYTRFALPSPDMWDVLSAGKGWDEDEFSKNWTMEDQFGLDLKLKRFYGQVILVDISAEWCGPCRIAAANLQDQFEERVDDGFIVFTILTEDPEHEPNPSAQRWADDFGLTAPVIADGNRDVSKRYITKFYPSYTIIDREHNIVSLDAQGGEADFDLIDDLLDEDPPDVDYLWPEDASEIAEALGVPVPTL
jgi:thiol-disulfide isomerase/thioredoxin